MTLRFVLACLFIIMGKNIILIEGKDLRQLNSFSRQCNGESCEYVVQVSTSPASNGTANIAFPEHFVTELKSLQTLIQKLAVVLKSNMLEAQIETQILKRNISSLEQTFLKSLDNSMKTVHQIDKALFGEIKTLKSDVERLYSVVKGSTSFGKGAVANVVSLKSDVPIDYGLDCASLRKAGVNSSGIYGLQPDPSDNSTLFNAVCDMETRGGGWTLIQRRFDGSDDFYRGWYDYKKGFGSFYHDFWLGLDKMHILTKHGNNRMRIDLMDWEGSYKYAEFDYVTIADESDKFRILAGGYSGTAGDPFHTQYYYRRMQSMQFSTFDNDNDLDSGGNCAKTYNSGWWFSNCFIVNLNGVWYPSAKYYGSTCNGIVWDLWSNHTDCYSLKHVEIRLRPEHY